MDAELIKYGFCIGQHIHQMGNRRALIAADIGHAGLKQRLGDGEDTLAVKCLALAETQQLHLFSEGPFGSHLMRSVSARLFHVYSVKNPQGPCNRQIVGCATISAWVVFFEPDEKPDRQGNSGGRHGPVMLTGEILRLSAARHPDRVALICDDRRIGYRELDVSTNRFANAVLGLGLSKGDTIAIMCRNLPEYVMVHFGNARAGTILVNTAPAYAPGELVEILGRTQCRLIVIEEIFQEKLASVIDDLPSLDHVVVIGNPERDGWVAFRDFLDRADASPPSVTLSDTDAYAMTFTGGTTGMPKGAVVSHASRYVSCWTTALEHEVSPGDVVGLLTPFYHAMGSVVWMPTAMLMGATAVIQTGWDPASFTESVARHGISNTLMVPVQLSQVLSDEHFDADRLASLRVVGCGGAISPPNLVHEIAEKMPWARFVNHYGQSETGPVCTLRPDDPRDKADTIGRPATGVELSLRDADGNEVPEGETGEIVVRGPFLMDGYFENPEETALSFPRWRRVGLDRRPGDP